MFGVTSSLRPAKADKEGSSYQTEAKGHLPALASGTHPSPKAQGCIWNSYTQPWDSGYEVKAHCIHYMEQQSSLKKSGELKQEKKRTQFAQDWYICV